MSIPKIHRDHISLTTFTHTKANTSLDFTTYFRISLHHSKKKRLKVSCVIGISMFSRNISTIDEIVSQVEIRLISQIHD